MIDNPQTDLRDRIAEALMRWAEGNNDPQYARMRRSETVRANAYSRADAVLAVLPAVPVPPTTHAGQLASLAVNAGRALQDERRHYRIACEENARLRATIDRVRRLHDALDAETDLTSPDDEITRGRAARKIAAALDGWTDPAELRRMAAEAQQQPDTETPTDGLRCVCGDPVQLMDESDPTSWIHSPGSDTPCLEARPACPDPIECSHEAALGQARQEVRRLGLMVDEYSAGASALADKLKRARDMHRETCPLALGQVKSPAFGCGLCEVLDAPAMPVQPVPGPGRVADEEPAEARCTCADAGAAFAPAGHYADCPCPEARQQHGPASTAPAAPGDPCS